MLRGIVFCLNWAGCVRGLSRTQKHEELGVSLGKTEVEYISRLAAIAVKDDEVGEVAAKLSNILDLFAQMEAADTQGVEPMAHPLDQVQRLRRDVISETDQHEKLQSVAPSTSEGLYLVPQVIE
jgi:aspartyl-tRNA(Asn)/glutamyl-tRNA(Gln) amidotransferase subunit C